MYAEEDDFEALRSTVEAQRSAIGNRDRFLQLDVRFHVEIAAATRNGTILAHMHSLHHQLQVAREYAIKDPHEPQSSIEIHERTLDAIMSRDPARIAAAMDEHLSYLEQIWEEMNRRPLLRSIPRFEMTGTSD